MIRLMVALFRLHRLEAESTQTVANGVRVCVSKHVSTPLTWGVRRKVILLPAALISGDTAICETALRHEQAHIARWDWVWNLLAEIVCAFCWYQPGVWWLRRRMRLESERACDDRVLLSGIAGPDYATHLLHILHAGIAKNEVAPAMAHSGKMEERMRHILDPNRPRRAKRIWLACGAPFGLTMLVIAALRVSARPVEPKSHADPTPARVETHGSTLPSSPSISALPAAESAAPNTYGLPFSDLPPMAVNREVPAVLNRATMPSALPGMELPQNSAPRAESPFGPAIPMTRVVWGKAVDGLEPGFLLNLPGYPNYGVAFNSLVSYRILVRNSTRQERVFEVQCQNHDNMDIPSLIPGDNIVEALDAREIPAKFRAIGGSSVTTGEFPGYVVKLAPGEAVVLPDELELYVGNADKTKFPRVEEVKPGMNWIVQPVSFHALNPKEIQDAIANNGKITMYVANRSGRAEQRSVTRIPALAGGKRLYAKIQLEVGTLDAEAPRNTDKAVWGKVEMGMQCGIRLLHPQRSFHVGDTLEAELLWRYTGNASITCPLPRPLDLYPSIHDGRGQHLLIDFGGRFDLLPGHHTFEPGEIRSLGVTAIKLVPAGTPSPKSNAEPGHITLAPGVYKLSAFGGVGKPDPESGALEFQVVDSKVEAPKADGIAWGKEKNGYRYGIRVVENAGLVEVWVQNRLTTPQTLDYVVYPPELTGSFDIRDHLQNRQTEQRTSVLTGPLYEHQALRPGEKAIVYAHPLSSLEGKTFFSERPRFVSGETYSIAWGDGSHQTGRVSFHAPVQN